MDKYRVGTKLRGKRSDILYMIVDIKGSFYSVIPVSKGYLFAVDDLTEEDLERSFKPLKYMNTPLYRLLNGDG